MKPFNIEEAKVGKTVCTRDGRSVRILCHNRKSKNYPIVAAVTEEDGSESIRTYTKDGYNCTGKNISDVDLVIIGKEMEGWVNVYRGNNGYNIGCLFKTEDSAKKNISYIRDYVGTAKIKFED